MTVKIQFILGIDENVIPEIRLTKSNNEFIFRADGDDINLEERFETQLPFLLNGFDVVGSFIDEYDEFGNYLATRKVPTKDNEVKKIIPFRSIEFTNKCY